MFDVKSLFNNVPLDETIETILQKVYVEKKIKTSIPKLQYQRTTITLHKAPSF